MLCCSVSATLAPILTLTPSSKRIRVPSSTGNVCSGSSDFVCRSLWYSGPLILCVNASIFTMGLVIRDFANTLDNPRGLEARTRFCFFQISALLSVRAKGASLAASGGCGMSYVSTVYYGKEWLLPEMCLMRFH